MKRWMKALTVAALATTSLVVLEGSASASTNIGWLYVDGGSGRAYFDADANGGQPGEERIVVEDLNTSDRYTVDAYLYDAGSHQYTFRSTTALHQQLLHRRNQRLDVCVPQRRSWALV